MALMSFDGSADLGAYTFVGSQQRHKAVSCAAGNDLDQTDIVEMPEAGDDIAIESAKVFESLGKKTVPETRRLGEMGLPGLDEKGFILSCSDNFSLEIFRKLGDKGRMRKLLEQDRREIQIALKPYPVPFQMAQNSKQRKISFGCGFVEPLHSVRPGSMMNDVRQMSMQRKGEIPLRLFL